MTIRSFVAGCFSNLLFFKVIELNFPVLHTTLRKSLESIVTSNSYLYNIQDYDTVIMFIICVNILSGLLGYLSFRLVRLLDLDTRLSFLRFKNSWHYIFSGREQRSLKSKLFSNSNEEFLYTHVDVMVDSSEGLILYSGELLNYQLNNDDSHSLREIELANAIRYKKYEIKGKIHRIPKHIPQGQSFIVNCSRLVSLNCIYIFGKKKYEPNLIFVIWLILIAIFQLVATFKILLNNSINLYLTLNDTQYPIFDLNVKLLKPLYIVAFLLITDLLVRRRYSKTEDEFVKKTTKYYWRRFIAILIIIVITIVVLNWI